jgi:hypothetical protein
VYFKCAINLPKPTHLFTAYFLYKINFQSRRAGDTKHKRTSSSFRPLLSHNNTTSILLILSSNHLRYINCGSSSHPCSLLTSRYRLSLEAFSQFPLATRTPPTFTRPSCLNNNNGLLSHTADSRGTLRETDRWK